MSTDDIRPEELDPEGLVLEKAVPVVVEVEELDIEDVVPASIKSKNAITMPLMRPIRIPPRPPVKWWNAWGKLKNLGALARPRKWVIEEEYLLYYPVLDEYLCIPNGFVFDGASVPRVLWPFMSPTGSMFLSGLFHDFGYRFDCYYDQHRNKIHLDEGKSFYDEHFKRIGIFINNANMMAGTAWFGLWLGGFMAWNEHRENDLDPYNKFPKSVTKE